MTMRLRLGVLALGLVGISVNLRAQNITLTCERAVALLETGNLAAPDSQAVAMATAAFECGSAGHTAVATALDRRRDITLSHVVKELFNLASVDAVVLDRAIDIALDPSASTTARVLNLALLTRALAPAVPPDYLRFSSTRYGETCLPSSEIHQLRPNGRPPADLPSRARTLAETLESDTSQPIEVRSAANCLLNKWRSRNGYHTADLGAALTGSITIVYECGDRFFVRSTAPLIVHVHYGAGTDPARWRQISLPAKLEGQPYSEVRVVESAEGPISLSREGRLLETITPVRTPCR